MRLLAARLWASCLASCLVGLCFGALNGAKAEVQNGANIQMVDEDIIANITSAPAHRIYIEGNNFKLDGSTLYIRSGSLHYFRVPAAYWRDRLRKFKAAGLNSVATYVEWSFHESKERQYRFDGDRDVASFIRIAAEEGLHVLLRPGPYICAERDLGGLPYWLLSKYPNIKLRSSNADFIQETSRWFSILFGQIKPLLFGNGGPIILVQVENEYGSYGKEVAYMNKIRDLIQEHIGQNALLYTTDGWFNTMLIDGKVSGALSTVDFGALPDKTVSNALKSLRQVLPQGPLMNSEYYTGWLTQWGGTRGTSSTQAVVATLRYLLSRRVNFNFFMFYGGTNFEFTSGALGNPYLPHVTSYDYDAPISEAGDLTPKYYAIRNLLKEFFPGISNITVPAPSPKGAYGKVTMRPSIQLLSVEGAAELGTKYDEVAGPRLPTFETLRQGSGFVLYETKINCTNGTLFISSPRDLVLVYVDGQKQGEIDRQKKTFEITIVGTETSTLSLFVENQGRVNYGHPENLHDFKGILGNVTLNESVLSGPWSVTGYPLKVVDMNPASFNDGYDVHNGPVLYEGSLVLPPGQEPLDTFINPTGWHKGLIWINGYNLGRYYLIGPQITLYVPGVWLRPAPAVNRVQILEISSPPDQPVVDFINHPILEKPIKTL